MKTQDTSAIHFYNQNIEQATHQKSKHEIISAKLHWMRALIFIAIIAILIFLFSNYLIAGLLALPVFIAAFGILLVYHNKIQKQIQYLTLLQEVNQDEVSALNGDFSNFYNGDIYRKTDHDFAADMDIFGKGSLFQMLNRAASESGRGKLAQWLTNPLQNLAQLSQRQESFKELSNKPRWRQKIQVESKLLQATETKSNNWLAKSLFKSDKIIEDKTRTIAWLTQPDEIKVTQWLRFFSYLLPTVAIAGFVALLAGAIPFMGFVLIEFLVFGYLGIYLKKINRVHERVSHQSIRLKHYVKILQIIEKEDFNAQLNQKWQQQLQVDNHTASDTLHRLMRHTKAFDNRLNFLFAIMMNGLFLYDLHYALIIQNWKRKYGKYVNNWFETIALFEAANAPATFAFNNPQYCFAQYSDSDFEFSADALGHPLIRADKRVCNDFNLNNQHRIAILTGANMAGKSTFLRTVGVNLALALNGMPVCAKKLTVSPIKLFTSVRIDDSLAENESYFFAELKRLQILINRLKSGEKLLVIIDEMLRGTNSKDKHKGSVALVKQIYAMQAGGIVATHDIALGQLSTQFPQLFNCRFEVAIENEQLFFDYQLKPGISQNLNATFLMQKMGIIPQSDS